MTFEWDESKNNSNFIKHGIPFDDAQKAFMDPHRVIAIDVLHSTQSEKRFFCFGKVDGVVLTVRFVYRKENIRIFGAGAWREGRSIYENQNKI